MKLKAKLKTILLQTRYNYVTGSGLISRSFISFDKGKYISNIKNPLRPIFKHKEISAN